MECLLCATSRLMHRSNLSLFSHPGRCGQGGKRYGKAEYGVGLSGFRMERWKGISIDENLKLMRCNNLPAVAFNFSSVHFCHTLVNSSSRSREQTEQIL